MQVMKHKKDEKRAEHSLLAKRIAGGLSDVQA